MKKIFIILTSIFLTVLSHSFSDFKLLLSQYVGDYSKFLLFSPLLLLLILLIKQKKEIEETVSEKRTPIKKVSYINLNVNKVELFIGNKLYTTCNIDKEIYFGKSDICQLNLEYRFLQDKEIKITKNESGTYIEVVSDSCVHLNRQKIFKETPIKIKEGDKLQLGKIKLVFS